MLRFAVLVLAVACSGDEPAAARKLELIEAPGAGDLAQLVRSELAVAAVAHKQLVVYVGASWCEPCHHFHDAAVAGELDEPFGQLRVLAFDADRDGDALLRAGYQYDLIPLFALPRADGTASGRQIEGSIKGKDAVAQITPRLQALLAP